MKTVDRVLRYKIEQAIKDGFKIERSIKTPSVFRSDHVYEKCLDRLAALIGRPHQREDVEYVISEMYPEQSTDYRVPREYATMEELVAYARGWVTHHGWDVLEDFRHPYSSACGCMGPQDDEPLCPCRMRMALSRHLDDVKMRIAEENQLGDDA